MLCYLFQNEAVIARDVIVVRVPAGVGRGRRPEWPKSVRVERQVSGGGRERHKQRRAPLAPGARRQGGQKGKEGEESAR
jgi:hypothetical protein